VEVFRFDAGDKSSLRLKFKKARAQFAEASGIKVRSALESHMHRLIRDLKEPGLQVCLYRSMADEPQFSLAPEREFFYPRLNGDDLQFFRPQAPFVKNRFGIEEPDPVASQELDPNKPTLVFCPAVAVDSKGSRLGMGKGYYDRYFSKHQSAIRAAVVYQIQLSLLPLHADSWDQPVDWIVTETMILRTIAAATGDYDIKRRSN
jgi:5-formyltetrahydrofolate cyclo-ligase